MRRNYETIPNEMRAERRWVLWELKDGKTKIPLSSHGMMAKANDPDTWSRFEDAMESYENGIGEGLGFMLGGGWVGIDVDGSEGLAGDCVDDCLVSLSGYGETSQSGNGFHFVVKGSLPEGRSRKGEIEMYSKNRFFAITGECFKDDPFFDETEALAELHAKYLGEEERKPRVSAPAPARLEIGEGEMLEIALRNPRFRSLWQGEWKGSYDSQSSADLALCSHLAYYFRGDPETIDRLFRQTPLYREKWDERRGEKTYGEMTVEKAVSSKTSFYGQRDEAPKEREEVRQFPPVRVSRKNYDLDDTGNAERFRDRYFLDLRYNCSDKKWMRWDGCAWRTDVKDEARNLADELIREMKNEAIALKRKSIENEEEDKKSDAMLKNAKRAASATGKDAMLKEARHMSPFPVVEGDFDLSPTLVNCENGVLDLETLELKPHDRKDMMSKCTNVPVDLENEPKAFLKMLNDVFLGNGETIRFIHKALGYTLSGETCEQCFFQCYGDGGTGKSTFFEAIENAMGDYALNAQIDTFLAKGGGNGSNASPDVARLSGMRFVRTNEPNQSDRFNEGFVKQATGGDVITARKLYGENFDFKSRIKLWIATNYKIEVRGTDKGIWRRQRLIPFEATFEGKEKNKRISEELKKEAPQILGWMAKGYALWKKEGLEMPESVKTATEEYKNEMDTVSYFAEQCVDAEKGAKEKAKDVFAEYRRWAKESNEYGDISMKRFGMEMSKKFQKRNIGGYVYYENCRLKRKKKAYVFVKGVENE